MSACPSVKVSPNQPKPTGTQKVTPSFMQPWKEQMELWSLLLSLFISGSISDTLICFSASFSVSLSPSLAFLSLSPSRSLLLFPLPYLLFLLLLPASPLPLLLNVFSLSVVSSGLNTCVTHVWCFYSTKAVFRRRVSAYCHWRMLQLWFLQILRELSLFSAENFWRPHPVVDTNVIKGYCGHVFQGHKARLPEWLMQEHFVHYLLEPSTSKG